MKSGLLVLSLFPEEIPLVGPRDGDHSSSNMLVGSEEVSATSLPFFGFLALVLFLLQPTLISWCIVEEVVGEAADTLVNLIGFLGTSTVFNLRVIGEGVAKYKNLLVYDEPRHFI